jgi:hypothetical protein
MHLIEFGRRGFLTGAFDGHQSRDHLAKSDRRVLD